MNETFAFNEAVIVFGESLPVVAGFETRFHGDEHCSFRLAPTQELKVREKDTLRASEVCPACTSELLEGSMSSVLVAARGAVQRINRSYPNRPILADVKKLELLLSNSISIHPFAELHLQLLSSEAARMSSAAVLH